jgi:4-alpha-glucanotransferase
MRIFQFAFDERESDRFLPDHFVPNTVAYTGTHDNDTTLGWWNSAPQHEKVMAQKYLGITGETIHWDMMRALSKSVANRVIFPMQDVLGLTSECRMNFPGTQVGNWEWRFSWDQLQAEFSVALAEMTELNGRR